MPRAVVRPALPPDAAVPSAEEAERELEKPPVIRPGDPEAQAAEVEKRIKRKPRARYATGEEIRRALELMGEPVPAANEKAAATPITAKPEAASEPSGVSATATVSNTPPVVAPSPVPASPVPSSPAPETTAPATSAPVPAPADPQAAPPASISPAVPEIAAPVAPASSDTSRAANASDSCHCRIEGTVEVVSDQPLPERVPVVVYLDDNRKITDSVELFMGSPRQFNLRGVPCAPHTIKVKALSKLKFMLTTAHPVVDCTGGGYRQVRIVMEPMPKKRLLPLSAN